MNVVAVNPRYACPSEKALSSYALHCGDYRTNHEIDLDEVETALGKIPDYPEGLSKIRIELAKERYEEIEPHFDHFGEFERVYFRGYLELARKLNRGEPVDFGQLHSPDQQSRFKAIGLGFRLSEVMIPDHLEEELAAINEYARKVRLQH